MFGIKFVLTKRFLKFYVFFSLISIEINFLFRDKSRANNDQRLQKIVKKWDFSNEIWFSKNKKRISLSNIMDKHKEYQWVKYDIVSSEFSQNWMVISI